MLPINRSVCAGLATTAIIIVAAAVALRADDVAPTGTVQRVEAAPAPASEPEIVPSIARNEGDRRPLAGGATHPERAAQAAGNPDLGIGQCEHYLEVVTSSPTRWISADWTVVPARAGGPSTTRAFASVIDRRGSHASTLGIGAGTGRFTLRQRSSLFEATITLDCSLAPGLTNPVVVPPTWPLNVHVLDGDGRTVEGVTVAVSRGESHHALITAAAPSEAGSYLAEIVPGPATVMVLGAGAMPVVQAIEMPNGPSDIVVEVPASSRFDVALRFERDGEVVRVLPQDLQRIQGVSAGHGDAVIGRGGRLGAERGSRERADRLGDALARGDRAVADEIIGRGYEIVDLQLNAREALTLRALGVDVHLDPSQTGSILTVELP